MKKCFLFALGIVFSAATFAQTPAGAKTPAPKAAKAEAVKVKTEKKSDKKEVKSDKKEAAKPAAKM